MTTHRAFWIGIGAGVAFFALFLIMDLRKNLWVTPMLRGGCAPPLKLSALLRQPHTNKTRHSTRDASMYVIL